MNPLPDRFDRIVGQTRIEALTASSQQEAEEKFFADGVVSLRRQAYSNSLVFKMVNETGKIRYFVDILHLFVAGFCLKGARTETSFRLLRASFATRPTRMLVKATQTKTTVPARTVNAESVRTSARISL